MTAFAVPCRRCQVTDTVAPACLLVDVSGADGLDQRLGGTVNWICSGCAQLVGQPISWPTVLLLVTSGAALIEECPDGSDGDEDFPAAAGDVTARPPA